MANHESGNLHIIDIRHPKDERKTIYTSDTKISSLSLTETKQVCIGTADSSLEVYDRGTFRLSSKVSFYRDSIKCTAANSAFDVIVSATKDGAVFVNSLSTGKTIRIIDLPDCELNCVCVTPSWGFIVISYKERSEFFISVYTVNGKFVRRKQITNEVSHMISWSSPSDFDFIAFVVKPRQLYKCEAFYLNIEDENSYSYTSTPITHISYSAETKRLFVVEQAGTVQAMPYEPNEMNIIIQ